MVIYIGEEERIRIQERDDNDKVICVYKDDILLKEFIDIKQAVKFGEEENEKIKLENIKLDLV